jgi:hypothetical protein
MLLGRDAIADWIFRIQSGVRGTFGTGLDSTMPNKRSADPVRVSTWNHYRNIAPRIPGTRPIRAGVWPEECCRNAISPDERGFNLRKLFGARSFSPAADIPGLLRHGKECALALPCVIDVRGLLFNWAAACLKAGISGRHHHDGAIGLVSGPLPALKNTGRGATIAMSS